MKSILASLVLILPLSLSASEPIEFECSCATPKEKCQAIENLSITFTEKDRIEGSIGNTDGEFSASFKASKSDEKVPSEYRNEFERFDLSTRRDYMPAILTKNNLLLTKSMKNGGTRIGGIAKISYRGVAHIVTPKGKVVLSYGCEKYTQ